MTATFPSTADVARAADLDAVHVAWSSLVPGPARINFGLFAVRQLRLRGVELVPADTVVAPAACGWRGFAGGGGCVRLKDHSGGHGFTDGSGEQDSVPSRHELREVPHRTSVPISELFLGLLDSPYTAQSVAMSVEEVADLLAALAERDLHWTSGEHGECGTLHEGQPEPPDLHVVFDALRCAWQRDDDRAAFDGLGDQCARWFAPNGRRRTWAQLQREVGPLTPDGGIAPTTPRDEQ